MKQYSSSQIIESPHTLRQKSNSEKGSTITPKKEAAISELPFKEKEQEIIRDALVSMLNMAVIDTNLKVMETYRKLGVPEVEILEYDLDLTPEGMKKEFPFLTMMNIPAVIC